MASSIETDDDTPAIRLRGVSKHYPAVRAVDGVDLSVRRGEVFGLIGHNGAGKSTLFKMMLGLITPTAGEIHVGGAAVSGRGFRAARRHMGYLPENVVLYDNLSGLETMRFFARLKGVPVSECESTLERVGLSQAAARPVREYSKGMRQRLGFAQALLGKPRVLFLDEPTTGLDPLAIRDFYATLRGLRDEGVTMILTSHILAELQDRVDRLAILSAGRVLALGSVQALREQAAMPLMVHLRLEPADVPGIAQALGALPLLADAARPEPTSDGLLLRCPRGAKMALLQALAAFGARVLDVHIAEPSLEDVFFGLAH
ncbi:ABC transporter ATP-binding protein [Aquabacterium sp. A7-Y]|uniref:ABC transporter ATP-binding protein n=1 Tax=Aquabacterium sp. A7-Y TaxID=1349605 RepID=UPI00223C95C6|nr:ABC transporter ATP-binding protein [Aquabacterium sp. A7-Y]MCW7540403.1 ABC transporter ATP-binding protein [Aquabacterium sp. A7-Y]